MSTEEKNNIYCVRCGKDKDLAGFKNESFIFCKSCVVELADEQYLDDGAETVIKEGADRRRQVRCDLNETESELDKMPEEF